VGDDLEHQCVEPTAWTGVQLCATIAEGFSMKPID
jgi:hypothetical protein